MMEISLQSTEMPLNQDTKDASGIQEPINKNEQTPESKKSGNSTSEETMSPSSPPQPDSPDNQSQSPSGPNSSGKKTRYKGKGVDANGRPRNFYNPPGKVLRSLANQSYYDSFYGNQGQIYTLKQKYKTQLCKHYLENSDCPLH
jgi:hypothetical protein